MPKPTRWTACTAQREDGSFCDAHTLPDAPFPICLRHASQLYSFLRGRIAEVGDDPITSVDAIGDLLEQRDRLNVQPPPSDPVVYYVRIGELIKIGTTGNLRSRMASYPPTRELLATEPGGVDVEAQRLRRFVQYRELGREWFRPGPDLLTHIVSLQQCEDAA